MRSPTLFAALLLASQLQAQETTELPATQPAAPAFAEPVTDTVATGANLPRLIEPVFIPAPAPAPVPVIKPYTPDPADLLEAKTIEQGGRRITYQRITPLPVPPPPEPTTPPTAAERAAFAARVAALRATHPREIHILLGGTLYLSDDRPPRAFCRQWPATGGEPISFWTNIDLRHLQGLGRFIGTDGTHYQLMMMWSIMDIQLTTAALADTDRSYHPPVLPDFPNETPAAAGLPAALTGAATFIPSAGSADQAGDLTAITELHKIYNLERPRLCAAHIARENARLAAEAALKANPPQPQDITLHYWLKTDAPQIPANPVPPTTAVPPPSPPSPAHPRRKGVRGIRPQGRTAPTTVMEDRRRPCQARKANAGQQIAIFACSTLAWLLGIAPAPAVLDVNGNGVSDAWEMDINNRQLLPANDTRATLALDDDGDGWTNGMEHAAGADPRDSSPPRGIIRPVLRFVPETYLTEDDGSTTVVPESVVMTWSGIPGKLHTVEHSGDLATWTPLGDSILCDGSPMEAGVLVSSSARLFLRVRIGDFDQDGDILTDYEEHVLKTNALSTDTDSDGKDDFFEASNPTLYDPLDPDQDDDGILDGPDGSPRANNAQASPDTAGLVNPATGFPTALLSTMVGRWDLEQIETVGGSTVFADGSGGGRHATPVSIFSADPEGMISKCVRTTTLPTTGHVHVPATVLDSKSYYSVSFWANIESGGVRNNPLRLTGLYGHSQYMPFVGQNTNWGLLTIETNGIWFEMRNGVSRLHAGRYSYANHVNGVPHYPASTNISGIDIERTLDDGLWHHYLMTMSSAVVTLYIDGILAATATYTNPAITGAPYTSVNFGRLHGPNPTLSPTPPSGTDTKTRGRLDRLRIWHSVLTATDALTLYREDADHDGLWDITESRTALWRDTNSDATRSPGESPFFVNPFIFDPPGLDHDRDGIASIDEQSLGSAIFDADSDDDGIPDGYDQRWCSGATTPDASLDSDADGDGLTLAQELAYGSNPNAPDSDDDGTGDAVEVAQGSHPALPGDAGQPPAPGATYAMILAVGDQSGSDSEDYHLVAYHYDPGTRQETEVYRLRSGGFGQYSGDHTIPIFRRDEQYTFRIQWQGSRLSYRAANPYQGITAEGPDFDYTMKVEPAAPVPGLVIEDAIDPATDQAIPDRTLAGDYSDVTDFPALSYQAAVKATKTYIDLAVDCSMDGRIDSLPDDSTNPKTLGYAYSRADQPSPALPLDRTYENQDPPRPVVIDINNDNSNLDSIVDCDNTTIDSAEDRYQLDGSMRGLKRPGHTHGKLRVEVYPLKQLRSGELSLRLSFPDEQDANIVRVFSWHGGPDAHGQTKTELLGPDPHHAKTSVILDHNQFTADLPDAPGRTFQDLTLEGLTYGTATIKLELLSDSGATIARDEVKVAVNVDQYAVLPVVVAQNKDAIPLRGMHPHYAGIQDQPVGGTTGRIRAVTGRFTCRVPSFKASDGKFYTQLTPMHDNIFRDHIGEKSSGQSFWVGVKQQLPNGNFTWAQCGLRWWWKPQFTKPYSTPPQGYVEAGTSYQGATYIGRAEKFPGIGSTKVRSLLNWHQEPVIVDFMLWKEIVATKADGSDTVLAPWRAIFRDARPGVDPTDSGYYTWLSASAARPDSGNNAALMDALDNIYMAQNMNLLDAKMECNNSISFAVGSTTQKAGVSGLKTAAGLLPDALPAPSGANLPALWDWMRDSYAWEAVVVDSSKVGTTVRNGRNDGSPAPGKAADGSAPHPYWRLQGSPDGFSLWDELPYGFGEIQINSRP